MNDLENLLESILFYRGEPVTTVDLAKLAGATPEKVDEALTGLSTRLEVSGVRLVREGKLVALATAPEAADIIEKLRKEDLEGPLGKAGLETLAIIVYQGPVSRADIEYVRGVNCTAILRSLTMRGLIERIENSGGRGYAYQATVDLPAALGVPTLSAMPGYDEMRTEIAAVIANKEEAGVHGSADSPIEG